MSNYPAILYVEDDPTSRQVMQVMLQMAMGLTNIYIFPDSENFLERVESLNPPPDIIFLDIHVPPYDGFEMLQMLRSHPDFQNTPIVGLTASVMNEEVARLKSAGFDGVIAKPIDQTKFPSTLERFLRGEQVWRVIG